MRVSEFCDFTLLAETGLFTNFTSWSTVLDKLLVALSFMGTQCFTFVLTGARHLSYIVSQLNPLHLLKTHYIYNNSDVVSFLFQILSAPENSETIGKMKTYHNMQSISCMRQTGPQICIYIFFFSDFSHPRGQTYFWRDIFLILHVQKSFISVSFIDTTRFQITVATNFRA
jgi:hypothetical protein